MACYHHVAEPLADADAKALREETVGSGARVLEYVAGTDGNPLAGATLDLNHNAGRRYMPPMSWPEVYQMYFVTADAISEKGSPQLVQKVYREYWEPTLGFRSVGQHARCATCARLAKTRRDSPDMAERAPGKVFRFRDLAPTIPRPPISTKTPSEKHVE